MSDIEFKKYLKDISANLDVLSHDQLLEIKNSLARLEEITMIEKARTDFKTFVRLCGPTWMKFSSRGMHDRLCNSFERLVDGDLKRLTISMFPRSGKSEFSSILLPAWYLGKYPDKKIIQASAGDRLAMDFGRRVKNVVDSPMFKRIFPGVSISKDSRASGKFATNKGGIYLAVGVNTDLAGHGGDLIVLDDCTTEQDAKSGKADSFDAVWNWFLTGPQQRLQSGGRLVVIHTRWSKSDLIGRLKRRMKEDPMADVYESIEFQALDENDESNFPEIWSTEELIKKRANTIPFHWEAQYQQRPATASGSIVPRHLWKKWEKFQKVPGSIDEVEFIPPDCHQVIMCLDTAFTANKRSNPTACTIWGAFDYIDPDGDGDSVPCAILLYADKKKMEFPELKKQAKEWDREWSPDVILIEAKTSGVMLRDELNRAGILTLPVAPRANEDKVSRLNSVTGAFYSGRVFYMPTYSNQQVLDEVAEFPAGEFDDFTDCTGYTLRYMRSIGLIGDSMDHRDEQDCQITGGSKYA
jgi:hypothetical protein